MMLNQALCFRERSLLQVRESLFIHDPPPPSPNHLIPLSLAYSLSVSLSLYLSLYFPFIHCIKVLVAPSLDPL
jgi:hypothetical protein